MLTQTFPTENFCPEQILGGFTFLLTPIGHFAYSNEVCEEGTNNGETLPSLRQITRTPVPCDTLSKTMVSTQLVNQGLQPDAPSGTDFQPLRNHSFSTAIRR